MNSQLDLIKQAAEDHHQSGDKYLREVLNKVLVSNKSAIKKVQEIGRACHRSTLDSDRLIATSQAIKFNYLLKIDLLEPEEEEAEFKRTCWEDQIELVNLYIQRESLYKKQALIVQKRARAIELLLTEQHRDRTTQIAHVNIPEE